MCLHLSIHDYALPAFGAVHVGRNNARDRDGRHGRRHLAGMAALTLDVNPWRAILGHRTFIEQRQGHIVNTFPIAGANPKELMARMGHDSERAALIYLHSTTEHQRALADAVGDAARAELAKSKKRKAAKPSGTRTARNPRSTGGLVSDLRPERDSNARPTA